MKSWPSLLEKRKRQPRGFLYSLETTFNCRDRLFEQKQKKLHRWHPMKMAEVGKIHLREASEKIGAGMDVALGVHQDGQQRISGCKGGLWRDPDLRPGQRA